ncbi:MAG TPA: inorganic phosphate transporter [Solirubrobacteraceae bacterium]|nr:inorganic phosphate transporter [Solirubrobacteraceae bacterium]
MGSTTLVLVIVIIAAVSFDFTNGFHDTANAMATSIATGALKPMVAVLISAALNFLGAFISISVATTIAKGIVPSSATAHLDGLFVVEAALIGAMIWNLITWYFTIPSSSSHALIGGLIGAAFASVGSSAVSVHGIVQKVVAPGILAIFVCGIVAFLATTAAYMLIRTLGQEEARRGYRYGQIGSASLVSLAHGTNDAQKTMGVVALALISTGHLSAVHFTVPIWVKLICATAMALGTATGGWRIINTMGNRITTVESPQGFSAESSSAATILASSYYGYPLSTTQVVSGGVMGAGLGKRGGVVHWPVVGQMVVAWVITLPSAALVGAAAWNISDLFGTNSDVGAIVIAVLAGVVAFGLYTLSKRNRVTAQDLDRTNVTPEIEAERAQAASPALA